MEVSREMMANIRRKLCSKRSIDVYNACVDIRKKVIKTPRGIGRLVRDQVIPQLLCILKNSSPEKAKYDGADESYMLKVKDVICSILGNLCMETSPREEVLKHDGIKIVGNILCTTDVEAIQNRCGRCIANMCLSSSAWKLVHDSEVVEKIVKLLKDSKNPECQQTYIRAVRLLGQTGPCVQKLLDKDAVSAVMKYIDSDTDPVAKSAVLCISHLVNRRNTVQFASQVVSSGKIPHLVSVVMETETSQDILSILISLAEQHNFRPAFGNAGGITLSKNLVENTDFSEKEKIISILCLCCKEAVNRVKLREEGVLKLFIDFLKDDSYNLLHLRIVSALVCFLYDDLSFDILLENGLVLVLVSHLRKYLDEDVFIKPANREGPSTSDAQNTIKEKTISNRSGKGTIGSDISGLDSVKNAESGLKTEDQSEIKSENIESEKENQKLKEAGKELSEKTKTRETIEPGITAKEKNIASSMCQKKEEIASENDGNIATQIVGSFGNEDPLSLLVPCTEENKPSTSKANRVYSIDSPTYEIQVDSLSDYSSGAKCKRSFSPSCEAYSPISNISYYSPVKSSPEYSPQSDRSASPEDCANQPLYSYCGLGSPYNEPVSSPVSGIENKSGHSPKSLDNQSNMETDQVWSWSPGESQASESDNELTECSEKANTDLELNEKLLDRSESSVNKKGKRHDEKDTSGDGKQLFSVEIEDLPDETNHAVCKKRKKSDNAVENNILILLSRVSQMTNPTVYFVAIETITCLLDYIIEMEAPLARSARLLSRVFRNPHCFQKLLKLRIPVLIYQKLLQNENIADVIKRLKQLKKKETPSLSSGFRSRSNSISSVSSDSDRFSLYEEKADNGDELPAKRQRGSGSVDTKKTEIKGALHNQSEELCDPGKCGLSFLEDLAGVAESSYGRGVVEKLIRLDQESRNGICLCAPYLCRNQGTIDFLNRWDICSDIFTMLEERQPQVFKTIVQGLSFLAYIMNFRNRFQSTHKGNVVESSVEKTANYIESHFVAELDVTKQDLVDIEQESICDLCTDTEKTSGNPHSYSCKECLCTFQIPCVLHSKHTCVSKDVTFIVKGERLTGCRNTLVKSSELFAAMLEGHYSESSLSEIKLSETSKFAFSYILHYLHGCKQRKCVVGNYFSSSEISAKYSKRLIKVLKAADKYLLYELKFELQDMLFNKYIIPETALNIFEYAVMYDCLKIQKAAVSCLLVDTRSQRELLLQFQKFMQSKFSGVFVNTLMELLIF